MMMFSKPEISGSMPTPRSNTGATRPVTVADPAGGLVDPRQQPQQCRLAGAVVPDQTHPVAEFQRHGDVPQRLDDDDVGLVASDRAAGLAEERLLQRARLGVEDGELHPRVARLDVR